MRFRRRDPWLAACVAVGLSVGTGPLRLAAQEFHVDLTAQNQVRFVSQTSVDDFDGVTDKIDGYVLLDGEPLTAETGGDDTELYFEVDLASLDTGIGLRNRHMRDNYLEVEKYPYASFRGRITRTEPTGNGGASVTAHGTFTVHGVERERDISCDVTPTGAGYRTRCAFDVLLSDHDIEIPKVMFLKLANDIRIELEFTVSPPGTIPGEMP